MGTVAAVLKWLLTHPFQIATFLLAGAVWHYHGAAADLRTELADTCHQVDPQKTAHCVADVAGVVTSRDAYKTQLATSKTNEAAATASANSQRAARAEVQAELERTQATQAAAEARAQAALRELRKARQNLAAASDREAQLRASLYATDPLCSAWGAAPVCPGISDLLRHGADQTGPAGDHAGDGHGSGSRQGGAVPLPAPAG